MKRLLLKVRHWLIKKLGGYPEQKVVIDRIQTYQHRFRPVVFRHDMPISMCIPLNEVNSHGALDRYKRELAFQIADSLIKEDMVKVECQQDILRNEMILSGRLYVVSPHDAAMCGL